MLKLKKRISRILKSRGESGVTLVEAVIAIAILGGAVLTMIFSVSGGALAVQENGQEVVAQNLARTQMEYIKNAPYALEYDAVSAPGGYGIEVSVSAVPGGNANIQKITVVITLDGAVIMTVSDYKVNR
jgi:type II secretory pathway pseudopilin PulG